jgi:hypothetical protein
MPAVKRRVFNVLAAVSLVLAIGSATFWYRGPRSHESLRLTLTGALVVGFQTQMDRRPYGTIGIDVTPEAFANRDEPLFQWDHEAQQDDALTFIEDPAHPWSGFGWDTERTGPLWLRGLVPLHTRSLRMMFPLWCSTTVLLLPPAIAALWLVCRMRNRRMNACIKCGYNLQATPDRCPECGTAVGPAA